MWPYWIFFLIPAFVALNARPIPIRNAQGLRQAPLTPAWMMTLVLITVIIGLRDQVGGDWVNYINSYLYSAQFLSLGEAVGRNDPAYWALNVLSIDLGLGIVGVNLFCGLVFATGLVIFCRTMPRPWLALSVAIPYMVIVVGMGYSRQSVALGFAMIALVALERHRFAWFIFWILVATTFHRSAVLLLGIALLTLDLRRIYVLPVILLSAGLIYAAFIEDTLDQVYTVYIDNDLQSSGALIRLVMNGLPALLFLQYRKKLQIGPGSYKLYGIISLLALASLAALLSGALSSTMLDRIGLYFIPLQVFVFSHLPDIIGKDKASQRQVVLGILAFYGIVMFVWLNFANHAYLWLPYNMFPPLDLNDVMSIGR